MRNRDGTAYTFAIVGVGVALAVMIIGASTIAALGHAVPKELWAIGGALSGALVGILVPPPRTAGSDVVDRHAEAVEQAKQERKTAAEAVQRHKVALISAEAAVQESQVRADAAAAEGEADRQAKAEAEKARAKSKVDSSKPALEAEEDREAKADDEVKKHQSLYEGAAKKLKKAAQDEARWFGGLKVITTQAKILVPLLLFASALTLGILLSLGAIGAHACPPSVKPAGGLTGSLSNLKELFSLKISFPSVKEAASLKETASLGEATSSLKELHSLATQSCSYYATATSQAASALIALASAAGGALIGLFAPAPSSTSKAA